MNLPESAWRSHSTLWCISCDATMGMCRRVPHLMVESVPLPQESAMPKTESGTKDAVPLVLPA